VYEINVMRDLRRCPLSVGRICIHPLFGATAGITKECRGDSLFQRLRAKIVDTEAEARPGKNHDHGALGRALLFIHYGTFSTTAWIKPDHILFLDQGDETTVQLASLGSAKSMARPKHGDIGKCADLFTVGATKTSCWWTTEPVVVMMMAVAPYSPTELVPPP
jgi:hypothetical protein